MKNLLFSVFMVLLTIATKSLAQNNAMYVTKLTDIDIIYKGFYAPSINTYYNQLLFTIQNNTEHIIYISSNHIMIDVFKDNKRLTEETSRVRLGGQVAPPDFFTDIYLTSDGIDEITELCEETKIRNKKRGLLKKNFSQKLYNENSRKRKLIKADFYYAIDSSCLILFPKEKIKYSKLFFSSAMNHDCEVQVKYVGSNTFTSYQDQNSNQINVMY